MSITGRSIDMKLRTEAPDLSWADPPPVRTAAVVYDTKFGHTRTVAEALGRGIRSNGVATTVLSVDEALAQPQLAYDLFAVGSPSHELTSSKGVHRFLHRLKAMSGLNGRYGYAFETRLQRHPGGAARQIRSGLVDAGLTIRRGPDVATIEHRPEGFALAAGTETNFEAIGSELVKALRGELAAM